MCKPTAVPHATLYVLFFVCIVGLRIATDSLLITYDDDDQGRRQLFVNGGPRRGQLFQGAERQSNNSVFLLTKRTMKIKR